MSQPVLEQEPVAVVQDDRLEEGRAGNPARHRPACAMRAAMRSPWSNVISVTMRSYRSRRPARRMWMARIMSEQEIALRHRQDVGRLAGQQLAVGAGPRRSRDRPRSSGVASLWIMSFLPMPPRAFSTATSCRCDAELLADARRRAPPADTKVTRCSATRLGRRRRTSAGNAPAAASGSRRWGRPSARRRSMPPLSTRSGFTPKKAGVHSTRSASLPASTEPTCARDAVRDRRVDRVLGDVALDAEVVVAPALAGKRGRAAPSSCAAVCQVRMIDLADAAHRLAVRRHHRERAEVVQDVLGRDRLLADAALGEGDVLGDATGRGDGTPSACRDARRAC